MPIKPLFNQKAFITGGSKGIGNAIANKISSLGGKVTILARNEELLKQQVKLLNNKYPLDNGELHEYIKFDLNEINLIENFLKNNKLFNESNILINCAGITQNKLLMSLPIDEIIKIININLTSSIILSKLFVKNINKIRNNSELNANIVNISSIVSISGNNLIGTSIYSASKAGLSRFTEVLSNEQLEIHNRRPKTPLIKVNAILPRHVKDTDIGKTVKLSSSSSSSSSSIGETTTCDVAHEVIKLITDVNNPSGAVRVV